MSVEIKTAAIQPVRQTFSHIARRLGADKPATRYQEATLDLQSETNFHYRPLWDADHELYDKRRTAVQMADWYALKDPRQFYYGAYVLNRARMQETAERNFEFVEKHAVLATLPADVLERIETALLPMRHVEYAANLNNCFVSAYGWGTAITQTTTYAMTDRLGIAQYLSRIGLLIDGNTGESLTAAKQRWLTDPQWQPLRKLVERTLVTRDWFESFVAQNFVLDGLMYPLVYGQLGRLSQPGTPVVQMLTGFMEEWFAESTKWVDAFVKTVAAESAENRQQVSAWVREWRAAADAALEPIGVLLHRDDAPSVMADARAALQSRIARAGLEG